MRDGKEYLKTLEHLYRPRLVVICSIRNQLGDLLRISRLMIGAEMLAVLMIPLALEFLCLPRSVIPLFIMGWASLWLRHLSWTDVGLRRPRSWPGVIFVGVIAAAGAAFLSEYAISPLLFRLVGLTSTPSNALISTRGNPAYFLGLIVVVWALAALGEELVYRGYVLNRLFELCGQRQAGWGIALVVSSLLFSLGHDTSNPLLTIGVFLNGLVEGALYLGSGRNLWVSIIYHGVWDTFFITLAFLGISL